MNILDFHKSFINFETDLDKQPMKTSTQSRQNRHNRVRIQIDCRCRITDSSGESAEYYLGESCKSERVGVTPDVGIFGQPNADFRLVLSDEYTVVMKSWDKNDKGVLLEPPTMGMQKERHVLKADEAFVSHGLQLRETEGQLLHGVDEIMEASDAGYPLVARTEYALGGYQILLDYPIFTLNLSAKHQTYQTDTGPVIFPELDQPHECVPDSFYLAFCGFNSPDWVEFIVQKPTPVGAGISVNHYSMFAQFEGCKNSVIKVL